MSFSLMGSWMVSTKFMKSIVSWVKVLIHSSHSTSRAAWNDYIFQISRLHQGATCVGGCRGATHDALIADWFHIFGPCLPAMMTTRPLLPSSNVWNYQGPGGSLPIFSTGASTRFLKLLMSSEVVGHFEQSGANSGPGKVFRTANEKDLCWHHPMVLFQGRSLRASVVGVVATIYGETSRCTWAAHHAGCVEDTGPAKQ